LPNERARPCAYVLKIDSSNETAGRALQEELGLEIYRVACGSELRKWVFVLDRLLVEPRDDSGALCASSYGKYEQHGGKEKLPARPARGWLALAGASTHIEPVCSTIVAERLPKPL